jgi:hypothetical protein
MLAVQLLARWELLGPVPQELPMVELTTWLLLDSSGMASCAVLPPTLFSTPAGRSWFGKPLPMKMM